ncbi:hypothetical protein N7491_005690 [Penicillium cf. griseofulvum]|uniref:F-box domain-containing protein n=1 Tax=Penicillium cf. griseofulvum TaxID=2972120 RepID=A0A9W9M4H0_9EURO|nr:hypothetical protein N7472_008370 [Penicillium cf. griseofulvum]KAJ5435095.1 hypothetical protein N7491_005690 [Penicillium cf. griseofulvum]KAJ5452929.1 hypothetical protein N7445_001112 [Penicillium cf. griseofulvum]
MSLVRLPTELILMIESNLDSKKDLNALIRTSPRFTLMFEDKLYKTNTAHQHAYIILWAAQRGLAGTIRKCLKAGAKVPLRDRFRSHLRDRNAPEAMNVLPRHPKPHPLTVAAEIGSLPCVRLLICQGVNPNLLDENYESPMRQAAGNGHVKVVKYLLKDADAFTGAFKLRRPLKFAAARGHLDVLKVLFSFLDQAPRLLTVKDAAQIILYEGLWHCHEDVVKFALSKGADVNDESLNPTLRFAPDLRADEHPDRPRPRLLQGHKKTEIIDGVSTPGWSGEVSNPLYAALIGGDEKLVRLIFDHRCDLNQLGPDAIRYAILKRDRELITKLMDMGIIYTPKILGKGLERETLAWEHLMRNIMKELGFKA